MKGATAIYRGRIVDKKHFRAFVYNASGSTKLVESWEKFQEAMQSGIWFATKEDAQYIKMIDQEPKAQPEKEATAIVEPVKENLTAKPKSAKPKAQVKDEKI